MKLFGVHGIRSSEYFNFWPLWKRDIESNGGTFIIPQFPSESRSSFEDWQNTFDLYNLQEFEGIITHSIGGMMLLNYLFKRKISVSRIFMVSPVFSEYLSSERIREDIGHNFQGLYPPKYLLSQRQNYCEEIHALIGKDDPVIHVKGTSDLLSSVNIPLTEVVGRRHFLQMFGYEDVSSWVERIIKD